MQPLRFMSLVTLLGVGFMVWSRYVAARAEALHDSRAVQRWEDEGGPPPAL